MAAMESRYQQPSGPSQNPVSLPASPSHRVALHSSLAGPSQQALRSQQLFDGIAAGQQKAASTLHFGTQLQQQQPAADVILRSLSQLSDDQLNSGQAQPAPALQLPMHFQQWLASLVNTSQASVQSQDPQHTMLARVPAAVPSPDAVHGGRQLQEDLTQMRAELTDVKAKFAETQV